MRPLLQPGGKSPELLLSCGRVIVSCLASAIEPLVDAKRVHGHYSGLLAGENEETVNDFAVDVAEGNRGLFRGYV